MDQKTQQRAFAMLETHARKLFEQGLPAPIQCCGSPRVGECDLNCEWWANRTDVFDTVLAYCERLSPEALGAIAAAGGGRSTGHEPEGYSGTSLYEVHLGTWLSKYESGIYLLRQLAVTALIARLYDMFMQNAPRQHLRVVA